MNENQNDSRHDNVKVFEWTKLVRYTDCTSVWKAAAHLPTVNALWSDAKCRVVDYNEFQQLVQSGRIEDQPLSAVRKGEVGVIYSTADYDGVRTWDNIKATFSDYQAGYEQAMKDSVLEAKPGDFSGLSIGTVRLMRDLWERLGHNFSDNNSKWLAMQAAGSFMSDSFGFDVVDPPTLQAVLHILHDTDEYHDYAVLNAVQEFLDEYSENKFDE